MGLENVELMEDSSPSLPLMALNHISFLCESIPKSVRFYKEVLGFDLIRRPSSFKFEGAWLFNYGIGIHLLERSAAPRAPANKPTTINPKDNHISFQCTDTELVKKKLDEMGMEYVTAVVEEGGIMVDQLFFHDPDGNMIEICDCQKLPVLPLSPAACLLKPSNASQGPQLLKKDSLKCAAATEKRMIEELNYKHDWLCNVGQG